MNEFQKTVKDIAKLKIQGAHAIALASVKALKFLLANSSAKDADKLFIELRDGNRELTKTRPTEPCMRNSLKFLFYNLDVSSVSELKRSFLYNYHEVYNHLSSNNRVIAEIGVLKIKNGMNVFTHCHSSAVVSILLSAKKKGVRFSVHNTETRPLFQGRKTSKELAGAGIPVTHYIDSAVRIALKKCDIMLIGADAITSEGRVINKIGSELFAEMALKFSVPVYSCTDSWKFDPDTVFGFEEPIEERNKRETWKNPPEKVKIDTHAFEIVKNELITGVISELGVFKPELMVEEVRDYYPWIMRTVL